MAMTDNESRAFQAACDGSSNGFADLYKLFSRRVYTTALSLLNDRDAALEALEVIFNGVYKHLDDLKNAGNFDLWVQRATVNYCRRQKPGAGDEPFVEEDGEDEELAATLPQIYASEDEHSRRLFKAFSELPSELKEPAALITLNSFTAAETATILQTDEDTADRRRKLAFRELKRRVTQLEKEDGENFSENPVLDCLSAEQVIMSASVLRSLPRKEAADVFERLAVLLPAQEEERTGEDEAEKKPEVKPEGKSKPKPAPKAVSKPAPRSGPKQKKAAGQRPSAKSKAKPRPTNKKGKKSFFRKLLAAAMALIIVAGISTCIALVVNDHDDDKKNEDEVLIINGKKTELDVKRLPAGLKELLEGFSPYIDSDAGAEYYCEKAGTKETNLLYRLMQSPPCFDYKSFSLTGVTLHESETDPYWYASDSKRFTTIPAADLSKVAKNVFNCSEEVYDKLKEDGQTNKLFYAYGEDYYCVADAATEYIPPLVELVSAQFDGSYYYVTYNSYVGKLLKSYYGVEYAEKTDFDEIRDIIKHDELYAVLTYKEENGEKYWALCANSKADSIFGKFSVPDSPEDANEENIFSVLPPQFVLSVGNDDWKTLININKDGAFQGYHVTNKQEGGENYGSTVYECFFNGKFGNVQKLNAYSFHFDLLYINTDYPEGQESVKDSVKHVSFKPIGFEKGTEFLLYLPGTEVSKVPPEHVSWLNSANVTENEKITVFSLYNLEGKYGFHAPGTAQSIPAHASSRAWSGAYKDFVLEERYRDTNQEFFDDEPRRAALYDAGTGIPYLLISSGSSVPALSGYRVYKYSGGAVTYVGTTGKNIYQSAGTSFRGIFSKVSVNAAQVEQDLRDQGIQYYDLIEYSDIISDSFTRIDVVRKEYYDYSGSSKMADLCSNHGLVTAASGELVEIDTNSVAYIKKIGWEKFAENIK